MRTPRALVSVAVLGAAACQPGQPYDHYWSSEHCTVAFDAAVDWSGMNVPHPAQASAYLRRANGASSLVVQVDGYGFGIADPYPSGPTLRFAVPPGAGAPSDLGVAVDASDVRGPTVVTPGTAWLIQTDRSDPAEPEDGWRFGSGTLRLQALALSENDTSDRDFVSLDAAFDLSGVTVAPLAADPANGGSPKTVGGALRLRCSDQALSDFDGGLDAEPGDDASDGGAGAGGGAPDAGDDGEAGTPACGTSGSCANPACGDCDGDPATFCETELRTTDHCGSCARSCGPSGTCDPLGACAGEPVASDAATAVAIGAAGVGYLGPSFGVRFAPTGGAPSTLASGGSYSAQDALAIDASDLYFASYAGLSRVSLPSGAPVGVAGTIQPDSVRLVGVTATHVYALTLNEQNTHDVVRRYDRTSYTPEIVACLAIGTYDATVSPSGAVFASTGTAVYRFDVPVGGSSCASTSAGALVVSAAPQQAIVRVVAGTSRLFYALSGAGGATVLSIDPSGSGTSTTLGAAAPPPGVGPQPLAADGDTPFWIAATPTPSNGSFVVSGSGGPTVPFAVTSQAVTSLAASPAGIAWADASGVRRAAR